MRRIVAGWLLLATVLGLRAAQIYALDNRQELPQGGTDKADQKDTHTPVFSTQTQSNLLHYSRDLKSFDCPNLRRWMQRPT